MSIGAKRRFLPPVAERPVPARDMPLDGLRGICALLVLYGHAFAPIPCLDPVYSPPDAFAWLDGARLAVLFFFVLSGYVIGLTVRTPFDGPQARRYLGRRLLRLVPVNTAAVLVAWALAPRTHAGTAFGNLLFLQNYNPYLFGWKVPVMANDASLWTLNFEMFYYLAFLAVWRLAPRLGVLFGVLAAAIAARALGVVPPFLYCYAIGGLFWFAGLAVAWLGPEGGEPGNWPSALLLAAVMWPLAPLEVFLAPWRPPDYSVPPLAPLRLDLLFVCLWMLLAVTGRSRKWQGRLGVACLASATAALALRFARGDFGDKSRGAFVVYSGAVALSWLLLRWRPRARLLAGVAAVGALSYGIYAVSLALQFGLLGHPLLPRGTPWSYALRLALLLGLSVGIAWILERVVQPALRRRLTGARPAGEPPQKA